MRKNKLLLLLVLLMTAATGAWAQDVTFDTNGWTGNHSKTISCTKDGVTLTLTGDGSFDISSSGIDPHAWNGKATITVDAGTATVAGISLAGDYNTGFDLTGAGPWTCQVEQSMFIYEESFSCMRIKGITVHFPAPAGYTVSLKDGVKDADKWTVKVGDGQAQALPIGGLKGDGSETVTLQYNGRLKVKGVKATSDAAPAAPSVTEVTTFSELQAALSAGKDVKLMNDIVCTEEINITSGALTIDGNGKELSTTSAIRAFKVGSSATVAFKNLILTGFVNGGGPAINNSGTIVLDECTISNCHVNNTNGGGAIENKGKLYAIKTAFIGNHSGEIGGAINNYTGSLYMSLCTFSNNYTTKSNAYWGGAIGINMGSEVRLINCYFSENKYGTTTGPSDIGVYNNPTNYTIAGCTGATIASRVGDITTIASGTATLDYSDLSNIAFTVEQAAKPAATVTTAPTGAAIVGVKKNTALVSGGVADGGTLMYAVTTTNTKPASTDGFSDAVPTAKDITASGTVYVWYYVKADDTHSDSEIAATAIEVPVADIVWDATNVSDIVVDGYGDSYEKEGVTLSANPGDIYALWNDTGDPKTDGISFQVYELGGFTFTAPDGKEFTKIEMKAVDYYGWDEANLGSGWAYFEDKTKNIYTVTWTGSAASTDKLLPVTDDFVGENVISIAFYLVDAE